MIFVRYLIYVVFHFERLFPALGLLLVNQLQVLTQTMTLTVYGLYPPSLRSNLYIHISEVSNMV